jgi:uncharacterized membrane protein
MTGWRGWRILGALIIVACLVGIVTSGLRWQALAIILGAMVLGAIGLRLVSRRED